MLFFLCTTALASFVGLIIPRLIRLGKGVSFKMATSDIQATKMDSILDTIKGLIPSNPVSAFAEGNMLQALVAIKCLDEGVNIPSIKTAFILASSTNPKEYIQRRGRVLRKFPGKDYAVIFDFITLPFPMDEIGFQSQEIINSTRGLVKREIIRMLDFAEIAENPSETYDLIYNLKHGFGVTEEELKNEEVNENVI